MHKRRMASFRLPLETIAQLDVLVNELQRRSPGKVSQADVIAWAVARSLDELAPAESVPKASPPPMFRFVPEPVQEGEEQAPAQRLVVVKRH
jgi:hypothetical protein